MALSKHVPSAIHVALHEVSEHKLIQALHLLLREEALLVRNRLHEVGTLVLDPLYQSVLEGVPCDVGSVAPAMVVLGSLPRKCTALLLLRFVLFSVALGDRVRHKVRVDKVKVAWMIDACSNS